MGMKRKRRPMIGDGDAHVLVPVLVLHYRVCFFERGGRRNAAQ